jgi:hypothetical protein
MSIFKRRDEGNVQTVTPPTQQTAVQAGQEQAPQGASARPPGAAPTPAASRPAVPPAGVATPAASRQAVAPGVLPPPAAPVVTAHPTEPAARVENGADSVLAEKARMVREAQMRARAIEDSMDRREPRPSLSYDRRRPTQAAPVPGAAQSIGRRALPPLRPKHLFDPVAATQAGLLNLAWQWQAAGSPIRAIHAYMQILIRYPGSPGADAAVADLVELSERMAERGQFHIALGIYDHLEELLA